MSVDYKLMAEVDRILRTAKVFDLNSLHRRIILGKYDGWKRKFWWGDELCITIDGLEIGIVDFCEYDDDPAPSQWKGHNAPTPEIMAKLRAEFALNTE